MNAITDPAVPDHSEKCFHCRLGAILPLPFLSPPFPQPDAATVCLTAHLTTPSRLQVQLQAPHSIALILLKSFLFRATS